MKITVTTTSQPLSEILTPTQLEQIRTAENSTVNSILIQVKGAPNIYIELGADATIADSYELNQGDELQITENKLGDVNLIADTSNNTDVRLLIN